MAWQGLRSKVRDLRRRKLDIAPLAYFDAALSDQHGKRALTPSERAGYEAVTDFDKVIAMFVRTGVWSRYCGPRAGHARLPRSWRAPRKTWHQREKRRKAAQDRMTETAKIATCSRCLELCRLRLIMDCDGAGTRRNLMNGLIYLVGLIVVILAILSFFGLR